ncbi:MAG: ATP-binding protein [Christensenellales bacterium]|jgi:DNA polymerase-3 subunit delta'
MSFSWNDILGQEPLIEQCKKWVASGTLPHAICLYAPAGGGKRTFTRILAAAFFCNNEQPPCGICVNCRRVERDIHPDLIWLRESRNIAMGITEANEIVSRLKVMPHLGSRRMIVLERAHTMTEQGQNKLLKTLEEPPDGTLLVLLSESLSAMLPTVLSRCALLRLAPLEQRQIRDRLEQEGAEPDAAAEAAAISGGWMGQAKQAAEDSGYLEMERAVREVLLSFPEPDGFLRAFQTMKPYRKNRLDDCLALISRHFEEAAAGRQPISGWDQARILTAWNAIEDARQSLQMNCNPGITLDALMLKLTGLFRR